MPTCLPYFFTLPNAKNMTRPNSITSGQELKRWYWLKAELVAYCKQAGISYAGAKFDILEKIAPALDGGFLSTKSPVNPSKPNSKFDWHSAILTPDSNSRFGPYFIGQ
jgi:hypothetical protein